MNTIGYIVTNRGAALKLCRNHLPTQFARSGILGEGDAATVFGSLGAAKGAIARTLKYDETHGQRLIFGQHTPDNYKIVRLEPSN